jgi:tRNA-dihydrouridine synthase
MIGRGIFGNPWFFSGHVPTTTEKLNVLVEHTKLFDELLGKNKNFAIMKKHFKAYVNGWDGAKELRVQLMETNTPEEVEKIIKAYIL